MEIWQAIVLGLIQGLTEFLPVSSSGHLLFAQEVFGIYDAYGTALLFDIILHIATLLAVIIVFRKRIWSLIKNPFSKTNYCLAIATAISCTLVVAYLLIFGNNFPVRALPFTFLITAAILLGVSFIKPERIQPNYDGITYKTSIAMGTIQGVAALFPGISRSGSTIAAGMATGTRREDAAEFSFIMSIPIIIASFVWEAISTDGAITTIGHWQIILGSLFAFVSAIFAIKVMLILIKKAKLYWFSVYLVALAIASFIIFY